MLCNNRLFPSNPSAGLQQSWQKRQLSLSFCSLCSNLLPQQTALKKKHTHSPPQRIMQCLATSTEGATLPLQVQSALSSCCKQLQHCVHQICCSWRHSQVYRPWSSEADDQLWTNSPLRRCDCTHTLLKSTPSNLQWLSRHLRSFDFFGVVLEVQKRKWEV